MRKFAIAGVAALAIAATTAVYAQHSWFHDRMLGHVHMSVEDRAAIWRLAEGGKTRPRVHAELPLSDWREAFELLARREVVGKAVIVP